MVELRFTMLEKYPISRCTCFLKSGEWISYCSVGSEEESLTYLGVNSSMSGPILVQLSEVRVSFGLRGIAVLFWLEDELAWVLASEEHVLAIGVVFGRQLLGRLLGATDLALHEQGIASLTIH